MTDRAVYLSVCHHQNTFASFVQSESYVVDQLFIEHPGFIGFVEPVYQECVEIEMTIQVMEFVSQKSLALTYKNHILKQTYIPDLICFDKIIVELKAVRELTDEHRAQVINYLKATGFKLGLLINFGHSPGLQHERFVL